MTDSIGSFAGIGSGLDYRSLVDQIIQVDSQPATRFQSRITAANAQLTAYKSYSGLLSTLETAAKQMRDGTAFQGVTATLANAVTSSGRSTLSAVAKGGAAPGSYAVQVLQTAQAEKLSGATFASTAGALGIAGDFLINGRLVSVSATDSLGAIRDRINAANSGTTATGVIASLVTDSSNSQRLVLTTLKTGASGINLVDGAAGVARQLGWIDATQSLKHPTSAGGQSDNFASATATIASQLGLSTSGGPQAVTVGGQTISIDVGTDSLTSIAGKLSGLTGIQATVQSTVVNGATRYYLDIRNSTSFVDAGNALGQLGVLVNGRSAVAQTVRGAALSAGNTSAPVAASTLLSDVWNGGSASGAQPGDTLTVSGTRGDGSAVSLSFAIGGTSTIQDVLDTLNDSTNGFGFGSRPATASIDASGHISVTDGTGGSSALSLRVVANNEGGGRLDVGAFDTVSAGRARELVAGTDARFTVDGVMFTRASNSVSDVIADTALTLTAADPNVVADVTIERSASLAQGAVQGYVDAYNKTIDFIKQQQTPGPDSTHNPTLYNDGVLRLARSSLSQAMLTTVNGAASDLATAGMAGISLTKDGHLALDAAKFQSAFTNRYDDVQKLFVERGSSTDPSLSYTSSTSATRAGNYDVNITSPASQAQLLGSGFSGSYADDGTPDTVAITDLSSNATARVQLASGMTTAQIVDAMNSAFLTPQPRTLRSAVTLNDASGAALATAATRVVDLRIATSPATSITAGDTIHFGGVHPDGIPYDGTFLVGAGSTVADLVASIQSGLGSSGTVAFADGKISVTSGSSGASQLSLALTAGNEGGGGFDFGSVDVTESGHGALSLTASVVGGQVRIAHGSYGSTAGVSVAFSGGGSNGTAQLGLGTGPVYGSDVQGTIGGITANGLAQQLVGAAGSAADGLSIGYTGTATGLIGSVGFSVGVGAIMDRLVKSWSDPGGSISSKQTLINNQIAAQQKRLDDFNARMEVRRASLLKQYLAMDTAVQRLRAQGSSFSSAFSSSTRKNS